MSEDFTPLIASTAAFVLGHFILSSHPLRGRLIAALGYWPFTGLYAAFAVAAFIWMNVAFASAPYRFLWPQADWTRWLAIGAMPLPCVLLAAGALTANPASVGTGGLLAAGRAPRGVQKVARHPIQWAILIWAALHLIANGTVAALIFFGGLGALSLFGMLHIEARKRREEGEAWARFAAGSSFVPFAGMLTGRLRLRVAEIGWGAIVAGLVLYAVLLLGHRAVLGIPLLPGLGR